MIILIDVSGALMSKDNSEIFNNKINNNILTIFFEYFLLLVLSCNHLVNLVFPVKSLIVWLPSSKSRNLTNSIIKHVLSAFQIILSRTFKIIQWVRDPLIPAYFSSEMRTARTLMSTTTVRNAKETIYWITKESV